MKKLQRGVIDPYGLGFIVITIISLIGGIHQSGTDQQQNATNDTALSEQESDHAPSK